MRVGVLMPEAGPRTGSRTYAEAMIGFLRRRHDVIETSAEPVPPPHLDVLHLMDAKSHLGWEPGDGGAWPPLVVDLHDDYWTGRPAYPAIDRPLRRWIWARRRPRYLALLERADAVVVHALAMLDAVPHDRGVVVPYPAEPPDERPSRRAGDGRLRVLFAGRDALRKGLPVLGEALRSLQRAGLSVEAQVVGRDWPHLRAAARWWLRGVPTRFAGELSGEEMDAAYRSSHLVALPSYTEAFGLVAQEALLRGVPVVASPVGGLAELVGEAAGGVLTPPGDAVALAAAIRSVASDHAAWCGRAAADAVRLSRARSPESSLAALEGAYRLAIERRGAAR